MSFLTFWSHPYSLPKAVTDPCFIPLTQIILNVFHCCARAPHGALFPCSLDPCGSPMYSHSSMIYNLPYLGGRKGPKAMRVTVAAREPATGAHPEASQALQQPVRSQAKAGSCSPLSLHIWILLVSAAWPLHPLCFTNTEEKACSAPVPPAVQEC